MLHLSDDLAVYRGLVFAFDVFASVVPAFRIAKITVAEKEASSSNTCNSMYSQKGTPELDCVLGYLYRLQTSREEPQTPLVSQRESCARWEVTKMCIREPEHMHVGELFGYPSLGVST
jgi:hypothetical protein